MFDWKQDYTFVPYFYHMVKRICYPGWHMQKMPCPHHNFTFVESGQGIIEIEGTTYTLKKGVFVYITDKLLRSVKSSKEDPLVFFGVNFMYTIVGCSDNQWFYSQPSLPFSRYQEIRHPGIFHKLVSFFNDLCAAWIGIQPDKHFRCQRAFMEIFQLLMEGQADKNALPAPQAKKVQQMIDFMTLNIQEKVTLELLSKKFNISVSYMDYLFRQTTGKPPMQYLAHIRINKAKQLLLENYSVTCVAESTGFSDIYYFSRYFKKMTGMSPTSFMNMG